MSTRTLAMCVAALLLAAVSTAGHAAAKKAECRYKPMQIQTPVTPTRDRPWADPTELAIIFARLQRETVNDASTPDRTAASADYIKALARIINQSPVMVEGAGRG